MELYLHESVLLLGLDDDKGNFTAPSAYFTYGFAAALIVDLILVERLAIEEERIVMKTNALTESKLLNGVLQRLQDDYKKPPKVSRWLHDQALRTGKLVRQGIDQLIRKGILVRKEKKVLWVIPVKRYPSVNAEPENELRARLRQILFQTAEPEPKERLLLGVLLASELYPELTTDKAERKIAKERIKALTEDSELRQLIGKTIQEMQMVLMATTTAVI